MSENIFEHTHRIHLGTDESQALMELASEFCLMTRSKNEPHVEGDKATLLNYIAIAAQHDRRATLASLTKILLEIEPQSSSYTGQSSIAIPESIVNTISSLGEEMGDDSPYNPKAAQIIRRLAVAYQREPEAVLEHIEPIMAYGLMEEEKSTDIFNEALSKEDIASLIAYIKEADNRSTLVQYRTIAIFLLFILTGLRRKSILGLKFKHIEFQSQENLLIVRNPDYMERAYYVYDPSFHEAFQWHLQETGQDSWMTNPLSVDPELSIWQDPDRKSGTRSKGGISAWTFYSPFKSYADKLKINVSFTGFQATYAQLLYDMIDSYFEVRCHLVPIGNKVTDVPIILK